MSSIEDLSRSVVATRRRVDQRVGELRSLVSQVKDMQTEHDAAKVDVETLDKVCGVLNKIGEERQGVGEERLVGGGAVLLLTDVLLTLLLWRLAVGAWLLL